MNNYYEDLGVARGASTEEIKRAYHRLARKLHPDVNTHDGAEEEFKKVSQAYDVLSDPEKRRAFDSGADPFGGASAGAGQGFAFNDVMNAFFGQAGGGAARGPRSRQRRGQDALIQLEVDLSMAVFGADRELTIDSAAACGTCQGSGAKPGTGTRRCDVCAGRGEIRQVQRSFLGQVMTSRTCSACQGVGTLIASPCFDCSGEGRVRTRRNLKLRVPAGVDTGTRIQLPGEGEVGPGAGPAGDLYVEVVVTPHETYQRRGDDLHCSVELPMTAAALGATIKLDTFDGMADLEIKSGTQPGDIITLKGKGVTHLRGTGRGDLLAHVAVQTPTKLTTDQEEMLRKFATLRGEERPEGRLTLASQGLFGKLRDAFLGK
ncbi:MAG: molecular chaperone DnaJ [Actinomycetota bacterium]|nr:molecular chaperone DnaJ [Actinomycetota bacterium]